MVEKQPSDTYLNLRHSPNRRTILDRYLRYAEEIAKDGTCLRRQVGAVLVRDNSVLATGFNGSPPGEPHCNDVYDDPAAGYATVVGCLLETDAEGNPHCVRTIHAEHNAILQAARNGISINGAYLYSTTEPCGNCQMILVTVGIPSTNWFSLSSPTNSPYVSRIKTK